MIYSMQSGKETTPCNIFRIAVKNFMEKSFMVFVLDDVQKHRKEAE